MRAVVMHEFGHPSVLRCGDVPTPIPGSRDVLVKVAAVSVNRTLDCRVRAGDYHIRPPLPHVLGCDPAGTVVQVGDEIGELAVGDRVVFRGNVPCGNCADCLEGWTARCRFAMQLGTNCWGGYAEYVCARPSNFRAFPDRLSFAEACTIFRHFPAAFKLLEETAELQAGEWLLVMGAAGALGSALVQVGKLFGATVIAGAGSDERAVSCLANGADFSVNYRAHDLAAEVMTITEGHGADVVAENVADPTIWPGAFNSLAEQGRLVTMGAHGGGRVEIDVNRLYQRRLRVIGTVGTRPRDFESTMLAAGEGNIHAVFGKIMPLCEAAEAHRLVEGNLVSGKVILEP